MYMCTMVCVCLCVCVHTCFAIWVSGGDEQWYDYISDNVVYVWTKRWWVTTFHHKNDKNKIENIFTFYLPLLTQKDDVSHLNDD